MGRSAWRSSRHGQRHGSRRHRRHPAHRFPWVWRTTKVERGLVGCILREVRRIGAGIFVSRANQIRATQPVQQTSRARNAGCIAQPRSERQTGRSPGKRKRKLPREERRCRGPNSRTECGTDQEKVGHAQEPRASGERRRQVGERRRTTASRARNACRRGVRSGHPSRTRVRSRLAPVRARSLCCRALSASPRAH